MDKGLYFRRLLVMRQPLICFEALHKGIVTIQKCLPPTLTRRVWEDHHRAAWHHIIMNEQVNWCPVEGYTKAPITHMQ
jgi:hypothetical protein